MGSRAKPARSGNAASTAATSTPDVTGVRRAAARPPPGRRRGRTTATRVTAGRCKGGGGGVADGRRQPTLGGGGRVDGRRQPGGGDRTGGSGGRGPAATTASAVGRERGCARRTMQRWEEDTGCRRPSATPHPPPPHRPAVGRVAIVLPFPHPPASSSRRWQRCCSPRACHVRVGRGGGAGGVPRSRWLRAAAR